MPSTYAHYRFGRDVFPKLPAHIRKIILQENDLFNIGLHGSDLLFYYHPLSSNPVNSKGYKIHAEPGITFFHSAAKAVQHSSFSKAYLAYIYGVICHFALDRECHGYIDQKIAETRTISAVPRRELSATAKLLRTHVLYLLRHLTGVILTLSIPVRRITRKRNCFLVENGENTFLVDCGLMAGSGDPYPRLTPEETRRVKYVFLTHSHADHTGALPWLYENGFSGWTVASACTLKQLPFPVTNAVSIESLCAGNSGQIGGIKLEYGRAGHCVGSVWYHFHTGGNSVLFSGDYIENSPVFCCDNIRGSAA